MCGIIGVLSTSKSQVSEHNLKYIDQCIEKLRHRGPNAQRRKVFSAPGYSLVLGHSRLSILDTSDLGLQPMKAYYRGLTIVYNGEIYNYIELRELLLQAGYEFKSESDTEVLLHAYDFWGEDFLQRLKGMFALCIFDEDKDLVFCARDSFGIKPLYYTSDTEVFSFASEVNALPTNSKNRLRPNWSSCVDYLIWGKCDFFDQSFYEDVFQLPPGHYLKIDLNYGLAPEVKKWYRPPIMTKHALNYDQSVEKLRFIFLNNVKMHMRSDVQIGAAVSGGIDSSSIVCGMRFLEPDIDINTFSYVSPGDQFDESNWASFVNKAINAKATKVEVSYNDFETKVLELVRRQGEPFGSTSIFAQYSVFQTAAERDVRVMLDGQGADEALAGYDGYAHARLSSLISNGNFIKAAQLLKSWSIYNGKDIGVALRPMLTAYMGKSTSNLLNRLSFRNKLPIWINAKFLDENYLSANKRRYWFDGLKWDQGSILSETLNASLNGMNGMTDLLRYQDRNSMAHSVESRVPFLTRELTDFTTYLPENYLLSNEGRTKSIFRDAMSDIVPSEILNRKDKIGFETPEKRWIKKYIATHLEEIEKEIKNIPILETELCTAWLKSSAMGNRSSIWKAWRVVNFVHWFNINFFQNSVSKPGIS